MKKIVSFLFLASLCAFVITGCANKNTVKSGDLISISYIAAFPDGKIFDQNTEQTPLMFTVGSGQVIAGIDEDVVGMKIGATKTVSITPEKGYGKMYDTNKIQKISQLIFDKLSIKPENGKMQKLGDIEGIVKGTEKDANGNSLVLFDINPRQTRETLQFKITILAKQ